MAKDLDLLQGIWSVTSLKADGQPMPPELIDGARIAIQGSRFTSTGMGPVYEGALQLDESKKPRWIDLKFDAGPEKGNTNRGIYELAGDGWKLCLATQGSTRPASFAAPAGSGFALETLVRGDAAKAPKPQAAAKPKKAAEAAPTGAATEFEGEWSLVSAVMDGKPMEDSMVKWVKRITAGNQTTVMAGPQTMLKVEFTHDSSVTPGTIDYRVLAGSNKGKSQYGIYEFEGALLKFCLGAPSAPRPAEFESNPGDGRTLTIWKKP
jgi:uncharacterized protein (TIGR03067 family)